MKAPYKIGDKAEVFNENDEVIEIIVKKIKDTSEEKDWSSYVIVSEEGDIYTQDEVNESYVLTPKGILLLALRDCGVQISVEDLNEVYERFVEGMKKHGFLTENKDEKRTK